MSSPVPGWYPDPVSGGRRWWDGASWTEFRDVPASALPSQPALPDGTSTGTLWSYLAALIPIAQLLAQIPYLLAFRSVFQAQLALIEAAPDSDLSSTQAREVFGQYAGVLGVFGVTFGLALLLSAAWVVLAFLDVRRLRRIGIVQPFPWAWSFLGIVYPIGRAVVLHRRIGRGTAPLWWLIGAAVASGVAAFGLEAAIVLPMINQLTSSSSGFASDCGC